MNFKIGLFDSGVGGFSVLKRVIERHGDISCVYLGDTARVPYGEKTPQEIRLIAKEVVEWFSNQDVSAILVGCNTTNSLALDVVQQISRVPVLGLINAAAEMISENRVGVLATSATASSSAYKQHIEEVRPGTIVFEQPCPAFVPMIEAGQIISLSCRQIALEYLAPLFEARVKEIILGCSHYPLLQPILNELIPKDIRLIDPAIGLAQKLDNLIGLPSADIHFPKSITNTRFCVTSEPDRFAIQVRSLLGHFPQVEEVSLQPKACLF